MPWTPPPITPEWCRKLPKVELHAHLTGSVSNAMIRKLLAQPQNEHLRRRGLDLIEAGAIGSLEHCFDLFPIIQKLISDKQTLRMVTLQVLDDFERDNTVYLELRTTPRHCEALSTEGYLITVLEAIADYHDAHPKGLVCRLLISVSRHLPVSDAKSTIALTEKLLNSTETRLNKLIVGIELSGNPIKGRWSDFEPVFAHAREVLGLPVSLHFGEIHNEDECLEMLDFKPDRVGHAVILSEKVSERLIAQSPKICVEVCLTSNLVTESVGALGEHPVVTKLIPEKHPFCLCTDDPGTFNTSLSAEYGRLIQSYPISRKDVEKLALQALDMTFCPDEGVLDRIRESAVDLLSMQSIS